jgi:paraquat-inducible protein B
MTAVQALGETLRAFKKTTETVNASTLPEFVDTLNQMEKIFEEMEAMVSADAPLQYDLHRVLEELTLAARAIRSMADLIDRHPESLIRGK